jgi:hypothetical protein
VWEPQTPGALGAVMGFIFFNGYLYNLNFNKLLYILVEVKEIAPHYIETYELDLNISVLEYMSLLLSTSYLKQSQNITVRSSEMVAV